MKKTIYCKTTAKDLQSFYVRIGGKDYFLFNQKYRVGLKEYFINGVDINDLSNAAKFHNTAVRNVAEKIPTYLSFVEKEYDVEIYDKVVSNRRKDEKSFNWRSYLYNEMNEEDNISFVNII